MGVRSGLLFLYLKKRMWERSFEGFVFMVRDPKPVEPKMMGFCGQSNDEMMAKWTGCAQRHLHFFTTRRIHFSDSPLRSLVGYVLPIGPAKLLWRTFTCARFSAR